MTFIGMLAIGFAIQSLIAFLLLFSGPALAYLLLLGILILLFGVYYLVNYLFIMRPIWFSGTIAFVALASLLECIYHGSLRAIALVISYSALALINYRAVRTVERDILKQSILPNLPASNKTPPSPMPRKRRVKNKSRPKH